MEEHSHFQRSAKINSTITFAWLRAPDNDFYHCSTQAVWKLLEGVHVRLQCGCITSTEANHSHKIFA